MGEWVSVTLVAIMVLFVVGSVKDVNHLGEANAARVASETGARISQLQAERSAAIAALEAKIRSGQELTEQELTLLREEIGLGIAHVEVTTQTTDVYPQVSQEAFQVFQTRIEQQLALEREWQSAQQAWLDWIQVGLEFRILELELAECDRQLDAWGAALDAIAAQLAEIERTLADVRRALPQSSGR